MIVWRVMRAAFAKDALSGEGAFRFSGRWNQRGVPMAHAASTVGLAALEYLAHLDSEDVPDDLVLIRLRLPRMPNALAKTYPKAWNAIPPGAFSQDPGTRWARRKRSLAVRVPSVLLPESLRSVEYCVLINPLHANRAEIQVGAEIAFPLDIRLMPSYESGEKPSAARTPRRRPSGVGLRSK